MSVRVAASEADLLTAVRHAVGGAGSAQIRASSRKRAEWPDSLGPTALSVLEDTLRMGAIRFLARGGAWRTRTLVVQGQMREGRLWTLRPDLSLLFGPASVEACYWLAGRNQRPRPPESSGDELCFLMVAEALRRARRTTDIAGLESSALVWLAETDCLLSAPPSQLDTRWERIVSEGCGVVLESLQWMLSRRTEAIECRKLALQSAERVAALGHNQSVVLNSLLNALDRLGRRDLADFLVDAAARLLCRPVQAWMACVADPDAALSSRAEAARGAAAFLRVFSILRRWRSELTAVPFFEDEAYEVAQITLSRWESLGREGFDRAVSMADELESMRAVGER